MYPTRTVSAPAWGNHPTTPASAPPLASPFLALSAPKLAPRPPSPSLFCARPGYTKIPASAVSETFVLLEGLRDEQGEKLRALPAGKGFWENAGKGGNLAVKRGEKALEIEMGERVKGRCEGSCCQAWTVSPEDLPPRPGAIESHKTAGNEALSDSPPALLKAIPRPT